ncbi:MAG: YceI family protein [Pyrinomonadaceae bacterium]
MKKFSSAFLGLALAALVAIPLSGIWSSSAADTKTQAAKVSYLPIPAGDYSIDPMHTTIGFAIRHLEINWVNGLFHEFKGTVKYDAADVTRSTVEFTAKIESIDTGVTPRNNHLKTADFFDAAKFPDMTFKSTKVERKGKDGYLLTGDFTLKGVTKSISFPFAITGAVKDPWGNTRFGIDAHTKINRRDYGINYGNALAIGGFDVGNEVTINLQLEVLQPGPAPAK